MLRTVSVFAAGMVLGLVILLVLFLFIANHVPERLNWLAYFVLKSLVGAAVGVFVGFFQKNKAGLVAVVCLLPGFLLQAASRSYPIRTGPGFVIFILGEALGLFTAFAIARYLSNSMRSATRGTVSG